MSRNDSEFDIYHIPPNFIEGGTVMGGLFKLRNVIEAGILAFVVGFFVVIGAGGILAILLFFGLLAGPVGGVIVLIFE